MNNELHKMISEISEKADTRDLAPRHFLAATGWGGVAGTLSIAAFSLIDSEPSGAVWQFFAGAIFVSHSMGPVRELCTAGALIENGKLYYSDDVEEAIERYTVSLDPDRAHPVRALPPDQRSRTRFPEESRMLYGLGVQPDEIYSVVPL